MRETRRTKLLCASFFVAGACSALLMMVAGTAISLRYGRGYHVAPRVATASTGTGAIPPWGRIEALLVPLTDPNGVLPDLDQRLEKPRWFFENVSEDRLTRFLNSCDLTPVQRKVLLDK